MKKTLTMLLLASSFAMADFAHFETITTTSTVNGITCTNGVLTGEDLVSSHVGTHANGTTRNNATAVVSITLNLTALQNAQVSGDFTSLVYINANNDLGIGLNSSGNIQGLWEGTANSATGATLWSNSPTYALTTLTNNTYVYTADGVNYIDLAVVMGSDYETAAQGWKGIGGLAAYDAGGNKIIALDRLVTGSNYGNVESISLNSDFITSATVYKGDVPVIAGGVGSWLVSTGIIPEPATATLSLLALAGLAARRRRR